jgi:hypothetical protein
MIASTRYPERIGFLHIVFSSLLRLDSNHLAYRQGSASTDPYRFLFPYFYQVYYILVKTYILRIWDENGTSYPSGKDTVYGTDLLQKSETQRWHGCYKCQCCRDYVIPGAGVRPKFPLANCWNLNEILVSWDLKAYGAFQKRYKLGDIGEVGILG